MGKLIFPIKEMPEAPQDGKVYLRQNSSWIRLNNVPSSIIPQDDNAFDVGSSTKQFKDLFLAPEGQLHVGGFIVQDGDSGILEFFEGDGTTIPETNLVIDADSITLDSTEFTADTIDEALEESLYFGKAIPAIFTEANVFNVDLSTYFGVGNFAFKNNGIYLLSFGGVVDEQTTTSIITINEATTEYAVTTFNDVAIEPQTLSGTHGVYLYNDGVFVELQSNRYHIYANEQLIATETEALEGTVNDKYMTPLRVAEATEKFAEDTELQITNDGVQLIDVTYDATSDAYLNSELIVFNDGAVVTIRFINTTAESTPGKIIFGDEETIELDVYNYTNVIIDNDVLKDKMLTLIYTADNNRLTVTDYSFKVYEATGAGLDRLEEVVTLLEPDTRVDTIGENAEEENVYIFFQDLNTTLNPGNLLTVKFPDNLDTTNSLPIYFSISNSLGVYQPLLKENGNPIETIDLFDGTELNPTGRTLRVKFNVNDYVVLEKDLLAYQSIQVDGTTDTLAVNELTPIDSATSFIGTEQDPYNNIQVRSIDGVGEQSYIGAARIDGRTKVTTPLVEATQYRIPDGQDWKDISSADVFEVTVGTGIFTSDAEGRVYVLNNTANLTITVPAESTIDYPIGTQIAFIRNSTFAVEFNNAAGVTINSDGQKRKIKERYSSAAIIKIGVDSWILVGNLTT